MSNNLRSIQLEVSNDGENYRRYKEVKLENESSAVYVDSMIGFFRELINEGKIICQKENYIAFRLRICTDKENFFLYDASLKRLENTFQKKTLIPDNEKNRYQLLTKKEREILCFLYKGYRQNDMAFIFGTTIHTIKKHRHRIYQKAGFRNQSDLAVWCEKYLEDVFERT